MIKRNTQKKEIEAGLKNSGFRLTESRKTVLDILSDAPKELTAEEVFITARKHNPEIGIATIYRTLVLLEEFKIIEKTITGDRKTKYRLTDKYPSAGDLSFNWHKIKRTARKNSSMTGKQTLKNTSAAAAFPYDHEIVIDNIQDQLDKWIFELNKIKKEKEIKLEEMMDDFSAVDRVLESHNNGKSNLIQILLDIQGEYNWLPKHVLLYVSNRMNLPLTQIYGIASFYKFFNLEPKGKYRITVCAGTACHVRGSMNLLQRIVNILKINPGDTTVDLKFTLETVNCLGCCALGPVMHFNNKYHSNPTTRELKKMFNSV